MKNKSRKIIIIIVSCIILGVLIYFLLYKNNFSLPSFSSPSVKNKINDLQQRMGFEENFEDKKVIFKKKSELRLKINDIEKREIIPFNNTIKFQKQAIQNKNIEMQKFSSKSKKSKLTSKEINKIKNLQQEISKLKTDMQETKTKMSESKKKIETLETELKKIEEYEIECQKIEDEFEKEEEEKRELEETDKN
ncbi:hypothetical protein [Candidatus Phytoplasma prunorum]|uniref:hypothetical protein n=1 Tax=Candidatus Phytoplasma prunorum TaxID=47565 RepID=UPI002FEF4192